MQPKNPLISVFVLNYNGKHLLGDCLTSLFEQDFTDFEVIVADNHSSDGSVAWVRENFPCAKIVENAKNLGFTGGNNAGIPACNGEWIFFLNNDTKILPNCISKIAEKISIGNYKQIFAPLMLNFDNPNEIDSAGDEIYPWGYEATATCEMPANQNERQGSEEELSNANGGIKEVSLVCGGAAVFSKKFFTELGGFDEDFFLYFEDVDLSLRARHFGAKIYLIPQAKVLHKRSATVGKKSATRLYYIERNRFFMKLKNFPLATLIKYTPHSLACDLLSFILWTKRGFFAVWVKSRFDMLLSIPKCLKKRKLILSNSKITRIEFEKLLKKESFWKYILSTIASGVKNSINN